MIPHPDEQYWTPLLIDSNISILARTVYLVDDLLARTNLIRTIALVPLDPVSPHFQCLLLMKLSGNAEASNGLEVGVVLGS